MTHLDLPFTYIATQAEHLSASLEPLRHISLNVLYDAQGVAHQNKKSALSSDSLISLLKGLPSDKNNRLKVYLSDLCFSDECGKTYTTMMGYRGASRLNSSTGLFAFNQECNFLTNAIFENQIPIDIVIPFIRSPSDATCMIDKLAERGLCRHTNDIRLYLACQVPANLIAIEHLIGYFDGVILDLDELISFMLGADLSQTNRFNLSKDTDAIRGFIKQAIDKIRPSEKDFAVSVSEKEKGLIRWLKEASIRVIIKPLHGQPFIKNAMPK